MTAAVLIVSDYPFVGGGPSGLSLALALIQNGVSVRVIDKLPTFRVGQKGSGIQPRILELYKLLGVLPDIQKKAGIPQPKLQYTAEGKTKVEVLAFMEDTPDRPYGKTDTKKSSANTSPNMVSQSKLGTELAVLSNNSLTAQKALTAFVRKTLGLTFLGETRKGDDLVVGDIHVKKPLLDRTVWHVWGEPGTKACRLVEKNLSSVFYETSGRTDIEFGDLILDLPLSLTRLQDSAHVHSPTGGQGLNSGIQDSVNLAWKLALVQKGLAPQSLLDTYTQERIPVIATMLNKTSELLTKTFQPGGASRAGWARGYELRQLGVNYRASPVIVDETPVEGEEAVDPYQSGNDGTIRGGDRAPDAPGLVFVSDSSRKTSLFDVFGSSYHTVLVFSNENTAVLDALKSYPAGIVKSVVIVPHRPAGTISTDYVLVDGDGYAYKHYKIAEKITKVVVVRPDGIIGALVTGVDGLKRYFKEILV
ncbi:hypothetical protein IW261DRAFT_1414669 [Armillaria novae-zelandiae]|uniref:FAD-binding domain-containing protein n=1 Tax=Armillaria novae-zelandiae TaxID=153914 RepID=A0AA39PT58_9AGAR|nr:hypothetical protein IW261DRAFT_1414669 [Armillaria novae-zelandiae]